MAGVSRCCLVHSDPPMIRFSVQVVLAYSGGLDTSVILKWLQDTYDCEVVTFTADLGQVGQLWTPRMCRFSTAGGPCDALEIDCGTGHVVHTVFPRLLSG